MTPPPRLRTPESVSRGSGEPAVCRDGSSRRPRTAGFTLVELIIVVVLGAVVLGATYQVLVMNQQVYTAQRVQVEDHGTVRAGLEVLSGELREISPPGGDLLEMEATTVEVRTMRSLGFVCLVNTDSPLQPRLTFRPRGQWVPPGQTNLQSNRIFVFADGNPAIGADDGWLAGEVVGVSVGENCPDGSGNRIRVDLLMDGSVLLEGMNMVHPGAPIRTYQTHRYGLMMRDGQTFLGRQTLDGLGVYGAWGPLVGPLQDEDGLLLEYFDRDGNVTTDPAQVQRIDVTLRTLSEARDQAGDRLAQLVTTSIYTRN